MNTNCFFWLLFQDAGCQPSALWAQLCYISLLTAPTQPPPKPMPFQLLIWAALCFMPNVAGSSLVFIPSVSSDCPITTVLFTLLSKSTSMWTFHLCLGSALNEPLINLWDLACRCKWQFSLEVLVAIESFSDLHSQGLQVLRKPHLPGSLVKVIFNLRYKCKAIIVLKMERALICKAEDS